MFCSHLPHDQILFLPHVLGALSYLVMVRVPKLDIPCFGLETALEQVGFPGFYEVIGSRLQRVANSGAPFNYHSAYVLLRLPQRNHLAFHR